MSQTDLDFINSRKFSRDELLAMWRVSPGLVGSVDNANRSNLEAGFYIHAVINIVPRVRQCVKRITRHSSRSTTGRTSWTMSTLYLTMLLPSARGDQGR